MTTDIEGMFREFPLFSHRGYHGTDRPENSIAAFAASIDAGCGVELDVRLTKDGTPVVFHDKRLTRLTGLNAKLSAVDYMDLPPLLSSAPWEPIPKLTEALKFVDGRVPVLVEVKNKALPGSLEEQTAEIVGAYDGPVTVQSFNPLTLRWFADRHPQFIRGLIGGGFWQPHTRMSLEAAAVSQADYLVWDGRDLTSGHEVALCEHMGIPLVAGAAKTSAHLNALQASPAVASIQDVMLPRLLS